MQKEWTTAVRQLCMKAKKNKKGKIAVEWMLSSQGIWLDKCFKWLKWKCLNLNHYRHHRNSIQPSILHSRIKAFPSVIHSSVFDVSFIFLLRPFFTLTYRITSGLPLFRSSLIIISTLLKFVLFVIIVIWMILHISSFPNPSFQLLCLM